MRIYLTGHSTFENRGCEAIVRSTVATLRSIRDDIEFLVPSSDIARDMRQWPNASSVGVIFVPAFTPWQARFWVRMQGLPIPGIKKLVWPFPLPRQTREAIASSDIVLAVGGDNYSLDYRLPTPTMAPDAYAIKLGKPVYLWGASVGPFENAGAFKKVVQKHLGAFTKIFVRETASLKYLQKNLGLKNVALMSDPAFVLSKDIDYKDIETRKKYHKGILGLNISPLIEKYTKQDQNIAEEVATFVRASIGRGYGVMLIPHVEPLGGGTYNSDRIYMEKEILGRLTDLRESVDIIEPNLNATQVKSILAGLRFFIGARTHATIGAMSSGVPTISIAYSVKAVGINKDLLPNYDVVIPTPDVCEKRLMSKLVYLEDNESSIRSELEIAVENASLRVHNAASDVVALGLPT